MIKILYIAHTVIEESHRMCYYKLKQHIIEVIIMGYVLNEMHRNTTDEELLDDIRKTANKLGQKSLTVDEYNKHGVYSYTMANRRFGSWQNTLKLSGLSVEQSNYYITDEEYAQDIKRVANQIGRDTVTYTEYKQFGKHSAGKISKRFGSWKKALEASCLKPTGYSVSVTDEDLLDEIDRMWIKLGRQPTSNDFKAGTAKYGLTTYLRHFGTWRKALESFIDYIDNDNVTGDEQKQESSNTSCSERMNNQTISHNTKRDINLRLRFKVLQRDNFACRACGASPAKDPSVELHVDHIIPWSEGGETVIDNLQTLCSKCNLGKSNML